MTDLTKINADRVVFSDCKFLLSPHVPVMDIGNEGLLGLLLLACHIWAIINILQSDSSNQKKSIWIVAVVLLPLLGLIPWFFFGPRMAQPPKSNEAGPG